MYWADKEFAAELGETDVPLFELGVECPVAGFVAQAAGFVNEEFGWVAFIEEDYVDDKNGTLDYAGKVLRPAPAERRVGDEGGRYDGS